MGVVPAQIGMPDGRIERAEPSTTAAIMRVLTNVLFLASRLAFGAFCITTSLYCLLFYIPFTYLGFIQNPLLTWLPPFVRLHSYLYLAVLAPVIATLIPNLRRGATRRAAIAFIAMHVGIGACLLARPALSNLPHNYFAFVWSLLWLFPLLLLACVDLASPGERVQARRGWSLTATTFAALAVSLGFAATSFVEHRQLASKHELLVGIVASLLFHLTIFTVCGGLLALLFAAARKTPWPDRARSFLGSAFAWLVGAAVVRYIVLPTLSFDGVQADLFAATVALAAALYGAGVLARLRSTANRRAPLTFSWPQRIAAAGLLLWMAYRIPLLLGPTDWDFVLQKLAVVLVWVAAVGLFHGSGTWLRGRNVRVFATAILACGGISLAGFELLASSRATAVMEDYAGLDISFKTAYDVLSRSVDNGANDAFYGFLRHSSNLRENAGARPPDIRLVDDLKPTAGPKPNIFFFVIDSLRQDYVSAYNSAVTTTPNFGAFARDSVVMQNAFTRYAGTALSEPALWVGAMQLHMTYLEPFSPMNSLQKLLDADGYQDYISVDPILQVILHPSPNIVKLDENIPRWSELEFCATLKELESKIDARQDRRRPIFAYTQPQNVHTTILERARRDRGRREVATAEVQRMDAAFGEFLRFLRQRGLYDNSIIILTSDHGDAYGEYGRYGHADFLFPEVVRIPLIVHLPPAMRQQFVSDPQQVAFSLDITPTLYYLLGHRPIHNDPLYGRPLFVTRREELAAYERPRYLLASSYAPVYGVLGGKGESLFIVDAVNHKNYFYDLKSDPRGKDNRVTHQLRDQYETVIRREIGTIDRFYHYSPPAQ